MMKLLAAVFWILPACLHAQQLSPQALRLKKAYEALQQQPHAPILQIQFIQAFPGNKVDFIDVFDAHTQDQLAGKSIDYIKKFRKLGYDYMDSVLPKAIAIGKELPTWSEGAVDELQKTIYYLTNRNPQLFVETVRKLNKEEHESLAVFLYAADGGKPNENYPVLLDIFDIADKRIHKIFSAQVELPDRRL
ncbi:MAG TPA: hypothetical protein VIN07_09310 [Flavipsychrobacter sp.]